MVEFKTSHFVKQILFLALNFYFFFSKTNIELRIRFLFLFTNKVKLKYPFQEYRKKKVAAEEKWHEKKIG